MFTKEEIEDIKARKPKTISYTNIAGKSGSHVHLSDVKRFFTFKTVPFEKALEIVKITNKLIKEAEQKKEKAMLA